MLRFFISINCFLVFSLSAQTDSLPNTTFESSLPFEVIIAENRLELPVSDQTRSLIVISKKDIQTAPSQNIAGVLQYYAGIDMRQRGPNGVQSDAGIRGGTFDQVLILLNGVKMSDQQTGHHSMNIPVNINSIERIEVLKGPSARVFGQNAFSGAINIITKTPTEQYTEIQIDHGFKDLWGGHISASLPTKNAGNHYVSIAHEQSEGYRFNTDYKTSSAFYQSSFSVKKASLDILAGYVDRKFGANQFYGSGSTFFDNQYEEVQTGTVSVKLKNPIGTNVFVKTGVYYRNNVDNYFLLREDPEYYHNTHKGNTIGLESNLSWQNKLGQTGFGIDANQLKLESNNLGERDRTTLSLFAEHRFAFADGKFQLTPGVQFNSYSDFGLNALPGVDLGYFISDKATLFANWGRTYRVPTFTDLYYEDAANLGNPNLKPEFANTYEIGLKTRKTRQITGQISYFYRAGEQIIDWTKATQEDKWRPSNLINVHAQGLDLDARWMPDITWFESLSFNYTYIKNEAILGDLTLSRYALENLKHQFSTGLRMKYGNYFSHTTYFRYYDRVNLEDYHLVDMQIRYDRKNYWVFAEATNLFDTVYRETNLVEMPQRWIRGGAGYRF